MKNFVFEKKIKKYTFHSIYLRHKIIYSFILFFLIILLFKIAFLQIISSEELIHANDLRTMRKKNLPIIRGKITDRYGKLLAFSVPANCVWADPKKINATDNIFFDKNWNKLSEILSIKLDNIKKNIQLNAKKSFIYLSRQKSPNIIKKIKQLKLNGIYLCSESKRYYPTGISHSSLIGLTDIDGKGIEGIEKSFDNLLTGNNGKLVFRKDLNGNVIEHISFVEKKLANNIILSINTKLQSLIYKELTDAVLINKASSGSAVLIDINTGEILAMVNSTYYNHKKTFETKKNIRNFAISDMFEPGSTVKPIVLMTALKYNIVNQNSILDTRPFFVDGHKIVDVTQHNKLTLTEILKKSSNVGVSKLSLLMPIKTLLHSYAIFGLSESTHLGLVGESSGFLPKKKWSNLDKATFSFGYGLMVTPIQLAKAYTIIGNYGISIPLSIIKINNKVKGKRVFPKYLVKIVLQMMETYSIKNYKVAIKTGTVKKIGNKGRYVNKYVSYTAGIAPCDYPRFSLVVIINNPKAGKYYGRAVSLPVFKNIIKEILY